MKKEILERIVYLRDTKEFKWSQICDSVYSEYETHLSPGNCYNYYTRYKAKCNNSSRDNFSPEEIEQAVKAINVYFRLGDKKNTASLCNISVYMLNRYLKSDVYFTCLDRLLSVMEYVSDLDIAGQLKSLSFNIDSFIIVEMKLSQYSKFRDMLHERKGEKHE